MCGLAGVIAGDRTVVQSALRRITAAQAHRGPDRDGMIVKHFGQAWIGLGHRRLSIIDISERGAQPMVNPRTGDQLIYNGEIYIYQILRRELEACGHQFSSGSDSEVLLYALEQWGTAALERLQGMFAFGFFKAAAQELLIARDPLGIKPLYYAETPGSFLFASEVRALLRSELISDEIDSAGLAGLLSYGAV